MFILFSITFGSYIAQYAVWWNHGLSCKIIVFSDLKEIGDELVHSIFAIKYWVLSMKIKEIISEKQDTKIAIKSWTIITF